MENNQKEDPDRATITEEQPYKLDQYFPHVPMIQNVNREDLIKIREWINTQPFLPYVSDRQVSIFLHSCCGCMDLTKRTISIYYKRRSEITNLFYNRLMKEYRKALSAIYMVKMPLLSIDKCHIISTGTITPDPSKFDFILSTKTFLALIDIYTNLIPYASGWRFCMDAGNFSFGHLMRVSTNLSTLKKTIFYVQDSLPLRLKGIHVRNANPFIYHCLSLIKPLMNKELYDLIHVHATSDKSLYEYIPSEAVPNNNDDCKGEPVEKLLEDTISLLEDYLPWFEDDECLARIEKCNLSPQTRETKYSILNLGRSLIGWNSN